MGVWEYNFEPLCLEFKLDALWQQCYLNSLCNSRSLFTALLIWLVMHYVFHKGSKIQTDSFADLASENVCSVVKSKVLCQVLKTEAKRVLDIFRPFMSWNKKEWYTKQMTELGTYSILLLHQSLKLRSFRSSIKSNWSHSRFPLSRSLLHWTTTG